MDGAVAKEMRVDGDAKFSSRGLGDDVADVGVGKWSTFGGGPEDIVRLTEQRAPILKPAINRCREDLGYRPFIRPAGFRLRWPLG